MNIIKQKFYTMDESLAPFKDFIERMWNKPFMRSLLHEATEHVFNKKFDTFENLMTCLEESDAKKQFNFFATLKFHSSRSCDIELVPEEIKAFFPRLIGSYAITQASPFETMKGGKEYLASILGEDFDNKLKGCFFKLSSRSAKDCKKTQANSLDDLAYAFFSSLRIPEDLSIARLYRGTTNLNFYEWLEDVHPSKEMRCFVFRGKLQGITKYQITGEAGYTPDFPQKVKLFVEEQVIPAALSSGWIDTFVVDVYLRADGSVKVLEFNPYELSDPCLYVSHDNIGTPIIIEEDIYEAAQKRRFFL